MIIYFSDKQDNYVTHIDSQADEGIIVSESDYTTSLIDGTRLSTIELIIAKNNAESAKIKAGLNATFVNEHNEVVRVALTVSEDETEDYRPLIGEDLALELINGSATAFESTFNQYIDYYVTRELYQTGWEIGINEIGTDLKRKLELAEETPLSRLQTISKLFDCEMSFSIETKNLKVVKKYVNIHRKLGNDRTDKILYSGVDVISIRKSEDHRNLVTAMRDDNHGFDDLIVEGSDGFFTRLGESVVYDRISNAEYGLGNALNDRRYIYGSFSSTGSTDTDNYAQALALLKEKNHPEFNADVDVIFDSSDFEVGDYVTFVDEEYNPPLRIKARILQKSNPFDEDNRGKMIIGNVQLLAGKISSDLIALQQQIKNKLEKIYSIDVSHTISNKQIIAKATVYLNGNDITDTIEPEQFMWSKTDKDGKEIVWSIAKSGSQITDDLNAVESVNSFKCKVLTTDNSFVQAQYFLIGLKSAAAKIVRLQTENTVSLIHLADTHKATDTVVFEEITEMIGTDKHVLNAVELTHYVNTDGLIINGDIIDGSASSKDIAKKDMQTMMSTLGLANCPYFGLIGNHDQNSWGDSRHFGANKIANQYKPSKETWVWHGNMEQMLTPGELHELVTRPSTIFGINENPLDKNNYYYYDIPDKKFRVICLNVHDVPYILDKDRLAKYHQQALAGYRQKQITWFAEVLKNTPSDYHVGMFQHSPWGERFNATLTYYPYNYELIDGIIDAFVNGKRYTGSYTANADFKASIDVTFTNKGTIAFLASGHMHSDRVLFDNNNIPFVSIACSVARPVANRPMGTIKEDAWDYMVINKEKRRVDMVRFGYGSDRSFNY